MDILGAPLSALTLALELGRPRGNFLRVLYRAIFVRFLFRFLGLPGTVVLALVLTAGFIWYRKGDR